MAKITTETLRSWAEGVITSLEGDALPSGASPRGRNSALASFATGGSLVRSRKGIELVNSTPLTGSPIVLGQKELRRNVSGTITPYHVLVSNGGRVDKLNSDGTTSTIAASGLTSGDYYPDFASANNLLFIVNGQDRKKYDGTSFQNFGITRPTAPTASATGSGAAGMLGAYEVALSYYNSTTGHESSLSNATSVTLTAGQRISVSWSAPSDTQVDYVRVHIRKTSLQSRSFLLTTGTSPSVNSTHLGFAVATTSCFIDVADASLILLTLVSPDTSENDPPPAGVKFLCWHRGRMFAADTYNLYYSKQDKPEAFDPDNVEPVNAKDSDDIVGLLSAHDKLLVFKRHATYAINGTDPASWFLEVVSPTIGAASHRSLVTFEGYSAWWDINVGPVTYAGADAPEPIGLPLIASTFTTDALAYNQLANMAAVVDTPNQRVMWALPAAGATRNTLVLPFCYRLRRWEADQWDIIDIASMTVAYGASNIPVVYIGSYSGTVFEWWQGYNDGVQSGSTTGMVDTSTNTTLVDLAASFVTTGAKLVDRYVYVVNADGTSVQRRRITDNVENELTVTPAWDTTPNSSYTYYVGGIDFQWDTPWLFAKDPFKVKRYEWFVTQAFSNQAGVNLTVDFYRNWDTTDRIRTISLPISGDGAIYDDDAAIYDESYFGVATRVTARRRAGFTGQTWRARFRNISTTADVVLYGCHMTSTALTNRFG